MTEFLLGVVLLIAAIWARKWLSSWPMTQVRFRCGFSAFLENLTDISVKSSRRRPTRPVLPPALLAMAGQYSSLYANAVSCARC